MATVSGRVIAVLKRVRTDDDLDPPRTRHRLDIDAERRSWKLDMVVNVVGLVVIAAAAVVGLVAV
ncbi:hypothetical protein [Streptomyces sp. NPDC002221]|uniref:hypothetical protein n=1 Tax=Streptomyces sp. NPDC002221 TaxID=3364639 RepID=UPI0036CA4452